MKNLIRMFAAYVALIPFILFNLSGTAYAILENDPPAVYVLGQTDYTSNGAGASSTQFDSPTGIEIDEVNARLFVGDEGNVRIQIFDLDSSTGLPLDGQADYVLGQSNTNHNTYFGTSTTHDKHSLNAPEGILYDSVNDRLFVADVVLNRILVWDDASPAKFAASAGGGNFLDATYVLGQSLFSTTSISLSSTGVNTPAGMDYDYDNDLLYLADWNYDRVLVYDVASITNGEPAVNVLGSIGFTSGTGGTTRRKFTTPAYLQYDDVYDRLFVAGYQNSRVMVFEDVNPARFAASGNGFNADRVIGQASFSTSTTATTQTTFNYVLGAAYDDTPGVELLFVADESNFRILVYYAGTGDLAVTATAADYVFGEPDFTTATDGLAQNRISNPWAVTTYSDKDVLYLTDIYNNRVLAFSYGPQIPEFSAMMFFVVVFVLGFAVVQKNGGIMQLKNIEG